MAINNFIKALKGAESLLLILPIEVGNRLDIADQGWLTFEIKNSQLVIKKIEINENSIKTADMDNPYLKSHDYGNNNSAESVSIENRNIA